MSKSLQIVGGGPAGMAAAIRFRQLCVANDKDYSCTLLEKAADIGQHTLSGAVIDPKALDELIPDWKEQGAPLNTAVQRDFVYLFGETWKVPIPFSHFSRNPLNNLGCYSISLGNLVRWMGEQAEELGVEMYPGFAGHSLVLNDDGVVTGVKTPDTGIDKKGNHKPDFEPGFEMEADLTLLAEGCRGSLSKQAISQFHLSEGKDPQTYGLGLKELWSIDPTKTDYKHGDVIHAIGWPLSHDSYGGGFLYFLEDNQVSVGHITALDYTNPNTSPYWEFQKFKLHPTISSILDGGDCLAYGARTIVEGGLQSLPKLTFPGGGLIGDSAGFLNVARIKGTHLAMKSGMLAAESAFNSFVAVEEGTQESPNLDSYTQMVQDSWIHEELYRGRNIRPAAAMFRNLYYFLGYAGIDQFLFNGKAPWTFNNTHHDHDTLLPVADSSGIDYPKPDNKLTFDRLTSVSRTGTFHEEDQPSHLQLFDESVPVQTNLEIFGGPETKYCPAGVYEFIDDSEGNKKLQINHANCIHCKACDIKDPTQNITWTTPPGSQGPGYPNL